MSSDGSNPETPIPAHAVRTETTSFKVPGPTEDWPFANARMVYDGDEFQVFFGTDEHPYAHNVTDEYYKWVATQPVIRKVIFEWVEEPKKEENDDVS